VGDGPRIKKDNGRSRRTESFRDLDFQHSFRTYNAEIHKLMSSEAARVLTFLECFENLLIIECLGQTLYSGQRLFAVSLLDTDMYIIFVITSLFAFGGSVVFGKGVCEMKIKFEALVTNKSISHIYCAK
jgi:hypothetical protein